MACEVLFILARHENDMIMIMNDVGRSLFSGRSGSAALHDAHYRSFRKSRARDAGIDGMVAADGFVIGLLTFLLRLRYFRMSRDTRVLRDEAASGYLRGARRGAFIATIAVAITSISAAADISSYFAGARCRRRCRANT